MKIQEIQDQREKREAERKVNSTKKKKTILIIILIAKIQVNFPV
jgi:hypothetical protein